MPDKTTTPTRWYHTWRSSARPAPDDDPADLGTAFGLDLSLPDVDTPPAAVSRPAHRTGWMQRLTGWRHTSA